MRSRILLVDGGLALLVAVLVVILSPGLAIVAIIALIALVLCVVSFVVGSRRGRRPDTPRRARR